MCQTRSIKFTVYIILQTGFELSCSSFINLFFYYNKKIVGTRNQLSTIQVSFPQKQIRIPVVNPFMPSALSFRNSFDRSIFNRRLSDYFLLPCYIEFPVSNANSVNPDQDCILRRLIWVYTIFNCPFMGHYA